MADETPQDPPALNVLDGGKAKRKKQLPPQSYSPEANAKKHRRVGRELWEQMEKWWLANHRSIDGLSKALRVSKTTAIRAVKHGWPDRGLPSLMERAAQHDRLKNEADARARAEDLAREADEMVRSRRDNLVVTRALRVVGVELMNRLRELSRGRLVTLPGGEQQVVPPTREELESLTLIHHRLSSSLRETGLAELKWIVGSGGAGAEGEDGQKKLQTPWYDLLRPDQLEYIVANQGRLPPDMTPEQLKQIPWAQQAQPPAGVG